MAFPWLFFLSFCSPDTVKILITILHRFILQYYIFSFFPFSKELKRGLTHEKTTLFAAFRSFLGLVSWYGLSRHAAAASGA
jgi:hypothetical protein